MSNFFKILAVCALVLTSACSDEKSSSETAAADNGTNAVIMTKDGSAARHGFNIETADTTDKIYHGLMGRTSLDADGGMLFDINLVPKDMDIAFWMKDTLIPLDILFVDENGEVFFIKENAQPQDTTPIYPPKRPRAVLEINGGSVDKYGINVGDMLKADLLGNN